MVGTAIQRTRIQPLPKVSSQAGIKRVSEAVLFPKIDHIISSLESSKSNQIKVNEALKKASELKKDIRALLQETQAQERTSKTINKLHYPEPPITKRELEVLRLIKKGLTNEEIGKQLFITERTVKFHITAILSKLNASNRTEAVDIALKRGFFSI